MKKPELIDAIASKTGNEKKVVASIIDSVFETIVETMKAGEYLSLGLFLASTNFSSPVIGFLPI